MIHHCIIIVPAADEYGGPEQNKEKIIRNQLRDQHNLGLDLMVRYMEGLR